MNTKQMHFNRQKVAAFLLAGSILAATVVSLIWTDMSANQAQWEAGSEKAGAVEYDSGASPEGQLLAGRAGGIFGDF